MFLRCRLACNLLCLNNLSEDYSRERRPIDVSRADWENADFALGVNKVRVTENSGVDGDKGVYGDLCYVPLQTLDQRSGGLLNCGSGSPSAVVSSRSVC